MSVFFPFLKTLFFISISLHFALFEVQAAKVEINGIEKTNVLKNVRAHIDNIVAPTASYQFEQYQQLLQLKVLEATQVFGYYHVSTVISPPSEVVKDDSWRLLIDLGQVTLVRHLSLKIDGQGAEDKAIQKLLGSFNLKQGKPLEHSAYENAKSQLHSFALSLIFT